MRDNLDFCASLVEQHCRLQRTLSTTHDEYVLTRELPEIAVLRSVGGKRCRNGTELRRPMGERTNASRDVDPTCLQQLAVLQRQSKASRFPLEAHNPTAIQVGHGAALEPAAVAGKVAEPDAASALHPGYSGKLIERPGIAWIGDMGGFPTRAQEHTCGHMPLPEHHGLAKHADFFYTSAPQMCRCR
jgi:hypothetical protein